MCPAKRSQGLISAFLARLFRPLDGKLWLGTATVAFCLLVGLSSYHLWRQHGDRILAQPQYRLNVEKLKVTPQPEWIRSDIKQSALTAGRLHTANLLDHELVLQVKQAFDVQPWVKSVLRVNIRYPSTIEIDLAYRRPVAMVEVPAGTLKGCDYEGLFPVDEEGYFLPVEMTEEEAQAFPRIGGVDSSPSGPPGSPWGDTRVAAAANIVILLEEFWQPLELEKVKVPPRSPLGGQRPPLDGQRHPEYVLVTRGQREYRWGSAPGKERPGEERAADKAAGLKAFLDKYGPPDSVEDDPATHVSELSDERRWRQ